MNKTNVIHIPNDTLHSEYILNRQSNNEYLLNNLTRCAIIFNYLNKNIDSNIVIDNVFNEYCGIEDPSTIPAKFLQNFELFMHIYLIERFGKMYTIFISEAELDKINFAVHTFVKGKTIFVLYSKSKLEIFMNTLSLLQYVYFKEKYFLIPRRGCELNTESVYYGTEQRLHKSNDELSDIINKIEKAGYFNTNDGSTNYSSFNSYCNKLINNAAYPMGAKNYEINDINNYKMANNNKIKNPNRKDYRLDDKIPDELYQIQANFNKIWSVENFVSLTYLTTIANIMEVSIRPILWTLVSVIVEKDKKNVNTQHLYNEFMSTFSHSVSVNLGAYTDTDNKASDFKYPVLK